MAVLQSSQGSKQSAKANLSSNRTATVNMILCVTPKCDLRAVISAKPGNKEASP